MVLYHGWDRDEMRQLGKWETTVSGENTPGPTSASFAPINPNPAPPKFISPLKTLHEIGVDGTYEHPHKNIPEGPISEERKQKAAQGNKGLANSIAQVWGYREGADIVAQNQSADFGTSFPKRRKSAVAKRNKSVPAQSKTLDKIWDQDNLHSASLQDLDHQGEQQGYQLTTPPDSGKRIMKSVVPSKLSNAKFKPGPFRNPVITKPSASHENEAILIKPVTIHQGWTSTEEVVKSQSNGISKTTLDKLAAFRFKPSVETQTPDRYRITNGNLWIDKEQENPDETEMLPPSSSSDYSLIPSDDSIFDEGNRIEEDPVQHSLPHGSLAERWQRTGQATIQGSDRFFKDVIWNFKMSGAVEHDIPQHPQTKLASDHREALQQSSSRKTHSINSPPIQEPVVFPLETSRLKTVQTSQQTSDHEELTSRETRELMRLAKEVQVSSQNNQSTVNVSLTRRFCVSTEEECRVRYCEDTQGGGLRQVGLEDQANPTDYSQAEMNEAKELPRLDTVDKYQNAKTSFARALDDVQVGWSDVDDSGITSMDVSNDFDLDEFGDDGLDDADLLAIASETVVPETQPAPSTSQNNAGSLLTTKSRSFEPLKIVLGSSHPVPTTLGLRAESFEVSMDDEYPLEEGLEEEDMMSLSEHLRGAMEDHQAPLSRQFIFDSYPMSREVYNKSLQFSTLNTWQSSTSPRKMADGFQTDENSPGRAGNHTDLDPILVEEEDWPFIRTDQFENSDAPLVSETPFGSPNPPNPTQVTKCVIPLGPQKRHTKPNQAKGDQGTEISSILGSTLDDSHEYEPLKPFARPDFPDLVVDRCPILGVSAQTFLRVCFRVGEMLREGARCYALKQDGIIELFARVTFSSREASSTKQNFQFADLWHDRPPFPSGILANYKITGLAESESRVFIGAEEVMMARCLTRLKKDKKNVTGWLLDIIHIRPTDWEEIKWTKRIVSAGLVKCEKVDI